VKFLAIEYSRDLHSRDFDDEWTPLHVASTHGHVEVVRILVEHGADVTARDNNGKTPLHAASRNGHIEVARFLISHGANTAARDNGGWTPLYWASIEDHLVVAHLLIEHDADPTARGYDGRTALGVDLWTRGSRALPCSAWCGHDNPRWQRADSITRGVGLRICENCSFSH